MKGHNPQNKLGTSWTYNKLANTTRNKQNKINDL